MWVFLGEFISKLLRLLGIKSIDRPWLGTDEAVLVAWADLASFAASIMRDWLSAVDTRYVKNISYYTEGGSGSIMYRANFTIEIYPDN